MEHTEILPMLRGLILMNVFGFRLKEADFWNKVYQTVNGESINIDAFKILRLSTAEELFEDERVEAQEAINNLSIEMPEIYSVMKEQIARLHKLIG